MPGLVVAKTKGDVNFSLNGKTNKETIGTGHTNFHNYSITQMLANHHV